MPGTIKTDEDRCKGCSLCVNFCPVHVLRISDKINMQGYHPVELIPEGGCTGCATCALMCPDQVITVFRVKKEKVKKEVKQATG